MSKRTDPGVGELGARWFEIQVRSVLEHAWAEIEHEVRYKSGINYPRPFNRSFSALAGALEVVEGQFLSLRAERSKLITAHKNAYLQGCDLDEVLDAARLLGLLEALRPEGVSWQIAEGAGNPFPPRIEAVCVEALNTAGIATAADFEEVMQTSDFRNAVSRFASLNSLDPNQVSHFAISVIVLGCIRPDLLLENYPELADDASIRELFK